MNKLLQKDLVELDTILIFCQKDAATIPLHLGSNQKYNLGFISNIL